MKNGKKRKVTKKVKRTVTSGIVHIQSTFNNTIVTITDKEGNVLTWASGGTEGFKGTRKILLMLHSLLHRKQLRELWMSMA